MKRALLLLTPILIAGCDLDLTNLSCDEERFFDERVEIGTADLVRVVGEQGDLRVIGRANLDEIRVRGTGCANDRRDLDEIDLVVQRSNGIVRVLALVPSGSGINAYLDLEVEVPDWMLVEVDDQSGDVEIRNVSGVLLIDESGHVDISDIWGDVEVDDQSGDLEIRAVDGSVWIWDESGDILVDGVAGDLTVERDSSGRLVFRNVDGRVFVP